MIHYYPVAYRPFMGQEVPAVQPPAAPAPEAPPAAPLPMPAAPARAPFLVQAATAAAVLGVGAAATWVGVRAGLKEKGLPSVAGWVGGIGSGLAALFWLTTATGIGGPFPAISVDWY